jgi:hypothetical protein
MTRADLIERLEKASGPDRELDADIFFHLECEPIPPEGLDMSWAYEGAPRAMPGDKWNFHRDGIPSDGTLSPAYTASIDAVVALVERCLPGWGYYLRSDKEGSGCGLVYPDAFRVTPCHCMGATPAIAVCLALLRALEAQEDNHG